jgi:hypothetical protein
MFLSNKSIVIPPASTGSDNNNNQDVIKIDQINNANLLNVKLRPRILIIVTIKFIAPAIDDIPDKCKLNIAISTAGPECDSILLNGGYTVQPVPAPTSKKLDISNKCNDPINNQRDTLFNRG